MESCALRTRNCFSMLTILFWNIKRRPLECLIAEIVEAYNVDVLLLAECGIANSAMLEELNVISGAPSFSHIGNPSGRIALYHSLNPQWIVPKLDADGLAFYDIDHPQYGKLLVVAAHLPSRLHRTAEDLNFNAIRLRQYIEETEEEVGHTRTMIIGDLNMNPFDSGVASAEGFHGVMSKRIAERRQRQVGGQSRRFFYNPMWSHLGDESIGPPGSYYYNTSSQVNYFWNTFDQVLIRPELLPYFRNENLRILTQVGARSLLTINGLPDSSVASDHLPLLFSLNF